MEIKLVKTDKRKFLDLLLLADEKESMIDKYLERGDMFALFDDGLKSVCVVTDEGDGVLELKNIATYKQDQKKGYGTTLIRYLFKHYDGKCRAMLVGTGDCPITLSFYEKCGFSRSHIVPNFFVDNYDHPMFENGKQLVDMIYLKKDF